MIAHVSGVPLEELPLSVAGGGVGLLVARTWIMLPATDEEVEA